VVAVETQGKAGGTGRVTLYHLKYSVDCSTFNSVLDAAGNEAVCKTNRLIIFEFAYITSLSSRNLVTTIIAEDNKTINRTCANCVKISFS